MIIPTKRQRIIKLFTSQLWDSLSALILTWVGESNYKTIHMAWRMTQRLECFTYNLVLLHAIRTFLFYNLPAVVTLSRFPFYTLLPFLPFNEHRTISIVALYDRNCIASLLEIVPFKKAPEKVDLIYWVVHFWQTAFTIWY